MTSNAQLLGYHLSHPSKSVHATAGSLGDGLPTTPEFPGVIHLEGGPSPTLMAEFRISRLVIIPETENRFVRYQEKVAAMESSREPQECGAPDKQRCNGSGVEVTLTVMMSYPAPICGPSSGSSNAHDDRA